MNSDTSWYEEGQNHFRNQPSTSGTQPGRPPDEESKEQKPDTKNIVSEVCLVDDEDDPEEAINSFHSMTRKKMLLPYTGVEIQEELKFIEAIRQFKMILQQKIEVLTLSKNLKDLLYRYLIFFATNYGRVGILYKDQYLDLMEEILLFYCDVVKKFIMDRKTRGKKMKIIQEARRLKILLRDCLLKKMDRIMHVLLKVRLAPEVEEYGLLWGDIYVYFLTKVPYKHTDDDILRSYIAFQKFKTIRAKVETPMIDKLMVRIFKKSTEELRLIPCLGEIMEKMKRDRMYTVRDMVTKYMEYYKEKRRQTECFGIDDVDEDVNINELRRLDLSTSFSRVPSSCDSSITQIFADRRQGVRKTVLDLASESNFQLDQLSNEFMLFGDDVVTKSEPSEPVVILDDEEEDDDVIVVCDNLKTVITIDDDDEEEPVQIPPTKSPPPPREALSPDKILQPPECETRNHSSDPVEQTDTSPVQNILIFSSSQSNLMDVDTSLPSKTLVNVGNSVPDSVPPPKEPPVLPSENLSSPEKLNDLVPKKVQAFETQMSTRQVKKVDNSLIITINSLLPKESVNASHVGQELETIHEPQEKLSSLPGESMRTLPNVQKENMTPFEEAVEVSSPSEAIKASPPSETLKLSPPSEATEVSLSIKTTEASLSSEATEVSPPSRAAEISPPKAASISSRSQKEIGQSLKEKHVITDLIVEDRLDENELQLKTHSDTVSQESTQPMQIQEETNQLTDKPVLEKETSSDESSNICSSELVEKSRENKSPNQIADNERMEVDFPTSSDTSGRLDNIASSTLNEEIVPLMNSTSISPIVKDINAPSCVTAIDKMKKIFNSTMKAPGTQQEGILPSSKIPSDLNDSPNSSPEGKFAVSKRAHLVSETSNISSPSFESIDKNEAKKFFEGRTQEGRISSTNETQPSTPNTSNNSTTISTSTSEANISITEEASMDAPTAADSDSETSDSNSSLLESTEITQENTVIQAKQSVKDVDELKPKEELNKPEENTTVQSPSEPGSYNLANKAFRSSNKTRIYSNLTECFTNFVEELSVEDIGASHTEELTSSAENLALSTIDLVPATENANDVIVVNCRPIEPLKDEEVSGAETVAFSADEVLATSNEPIALFLMCDANLELSHDPLAFSNDEIAPVSDNTAPVISKVSDKTICDTDRTILHHEKETTDGPLPFSGSQPYTPQSSPNTRLEVKQDSNNESFHTVELRPLHFVAASDLSFHPLHESAIIKDNESEEDLHNPSKPSEQVSKLIINQGTKGKISTENSLRTQRKSFDLSRDEIGKLEERTMMKNCDTTLKTSENAVEDFREDLSQSVTSATRVTPQEVDRISQLPFKYSQQLWNDKSQQGPDISPTNLSQSKTIMSAKTTIVVQQKSSDLLQSPKIPQPENVALSQQTLKVVSKSDAGLLSSLDRQINDLTCPASFVEEKMNELYIKEYGTSLAQQSNRLSQAKIQNKRRESQEAPSPVRPIKIYAKDKPTKDLSQPKDRDISLKSYKALIKGVSKRRASLSQKEEGMSQPPNRKLKVSVDLPQQKIVNDPGEETAPRDDVYDHSELFNNGIEGPIGKPIVSNNSDDNFFWDSDNDSPNKHAEDAFEGTISVKPDSQLYQAKKDQSTSPKKNSVSSLKGSKPKENNGSLEKKSSLGKKKDPFGSKTEMGLYVKLAPIDIESYQRKLIQANEMKKRQMYLANEMKKKQQRQLSLAQEMQEKQQQSLQRDQILIQIYSKKSEATPRPHHNWFAKAKTSSFLTNLNVSSRDESHFIKGKVREQPVHRNGQRVAEKRKNRDFDPEDEISRKKMALRTDLMDKKTKNTTPNGKSITPKLKPIIKSVKVSDAASSKDVAIEGNDINETPSSPIKMTKSGRVCKKPRPDYDDVIKSHFNGSSGKVKKSVRFKL